MDLGTQALYGVATYLVFQLGKIQSWSKWANLGLYLLTSVVVGVLALGGTDVSSLVKNGVGVAEASSLIYGIGAVLGLNDKLGKAEIFKVILSALTNATTHAVNPKGTDTPST